MIHAPPAVAALAVLLGAAACWDVARRRIPNALTAALAVAGLAVQLAGAGPRAALGALGAAGIVLAALWIPWQKGAIGGGDLKLGVGAATWVGLGALPRYAAVGLVSTGVLAAACYALSARAARAEIRANLGHAALGLGARPVLAARGRVPVPAGVAIAAGALAAVLLPG